MFEALNCMVCAEGIPLPCQRLLRDVCTCSPRSAGHPCSLLELPSPVSTSGILMLDFFHTVPTSPVGSSTVCLKV